MNTSLLLFIHGLGGNGPKTWGKFPELIEADTDLSKFDVSFFNYPTSLFRFPFFSKKYPKIQMLAKALKTQIDIRYSEYSEIVLVCHSLGGLIARKYLVDQAMSPAPLRVRALVLFAVPNNGAGLASVAKQISWRHNQLRQLCKDSDLIEGINEVWFRLNVEDKLQVTYVVAALDLAVDELSAQAFWGNPNIEVVADRGHIDVVKPSNNEDTSFLILRKAVIFMLEPIDREEQDGLKPYTTTPCRQQLAQARHGLKYRVIAFDFDGTLLRGLEFSWTKIWKYLEFPEAVYKEGMRRYLRGETTYEEWCKWACQQFRLRSLNRTQFSEITKDLTVTNKFHETLSILKNDGFVLALISGGIDTFLEEKIPDADKLFDYICINHLLFDDQGVINGVNATPFDFEGKAIGLERICKRHGATMAQAVFVGEGFNDGEVAKKAGLSIAYPPHAQSFKAVAGVTIEEDDLTKILKHVL